MKALAILFSVIFVAAAIGFGLSVAVSGINYDEALGFGGNIEEGGGYHEYEFPDLDYRDIAISSLSADTRVSLSNDHVARVYYETNRQGTSLSACIEGEKLVIKEQSNPSFWFFNWGFGGYSRLVVELPDEVFNRIEYSTASGNGDATLPDAERLKVSTSSGDVRLIGYAKDLDITTMSGDIDILNSGDKKCADITLSNSSGRTELYGFATDTYKLSCMSGEVIASGISGRGNVLVTSGDVELIYQDWNDSLSVSVMSGNLDIYLPQDSGLDLTSSITSGDVGFDFNGNREILDRSDKSKTIGGGNKQKVTLSMTSGNVYFEYSKRTDFGNETAVTMIDVIPVEVPGAGAY